MLCSETSPRLFHVAKVHSLYSVVFHFESIPTFIYPLYYWQYWSCLQWIILLHTQIVYVSSCTCARVLGMSIYITLPDKAKLFFKVVVTIYTPISNVKCSQLFCILINICYHIKLTLNVSNVYLYFSWFINEVDHFSIDLVNRVSSSVNYLASISPIFLLDCLFSY